MQEIWINTERDSDKRTWLSFFLHAENIFSLTKHRLKQIQFFYSLFSLLGFVGVWNSTQTLWINQFRTLLLPPHSLLHASPLLLASPNLHCKSFPFFLPNFWFSFCLGLFRWRENEMSFIQLFGFVGWVFFIVRKQNGKSWMGFDLCFSLFGCLFVIFGAFLGTQT